MSMQMKMTMHGLKFNPALDDSLFVFTPPPDAKETAELIPGLSIAGPKEKSPVVAVAKPSAPAPGDPRAFVPNLSPLHDKEPVYPASAEGQSGMVHALVTIGATGNVVNVEVLSGKEIFRQAAIDAIQQRTYRPVIRDEKPVPAYTDAMVTFFQDKSAKGIESDFVADVGEEMKAAMRIQELTAAMPRTSAQVLGDLEQQDSGAGGIKRFYALSDLAKGALDAGLNDKAQSYANEMLTMAARYPEDWNYGNAIYTGNTVLGMVALRNGDVAQAKEYLLTSARISGSPQLDSFGPDFRLAKELAQKGEKDAVLQYLDLCRGFWKMGGEQLTSMEAAVRNGEAF
jgi:TonB family protein